MHQTPLTGYEKTSECGPVAMHLFPAVARHSHLFPHEPLKLSKGGAVNILLTFLPFRPIGPLTNYYIGLASHRMEKQ